MKPKKTTERHNAIYPRVSTIDQDCASQLPDLQTWAHAQREPSVWYQDTFTGSEMSRPNFDRLLQDARAGKVKRLVVWRLDRLGRTAKGLTELFDELQRLGVVLVSIRDGLDLSTPAGRLVANILAAVAQYEWEVIRERIVAGIAAAKAQGKRWGGSQKGWRSKRVEAKAAAVAQLAERGMGATAIARALHLGRNTVYRLLRGEESSGE